MKLFLKSKALVVEFCDRCGRACDAVCRAAAVREETLQRGLRFGGRI